ncbi:SDR family oxidoreductase [Streptomyces sp. RFCAC02]|uniref:SDR family NAD(P)-dependent oxidoreductase n=1 Tax=Streptomyces sp. RFCAC02 TaxID=2499143 RepID=UPI00143D3B17|nr:SDR family oxidoreductase [Streptomyces sp. RFCAC02]
MSEPFRLDGRRALITGAGRGIGRAAALLLARQGARVTVVARTAADVEAVAGEIGDAGGAAHWIAADCAEPVAAEGAVAEAADLMGGLDILVGNVGGWGDAPGVTGPLTGVTAAAIDSVFGMNVKAPLLTMMAAARAMTAQGTGGAIVSTASIDGLFPAPGEALYGAAKAALISLTSTLAYELGPSGIRVNAVAPALIETAMTEPWLADPDDRQDRASLYPLGRFGTPDDVAAAVLYLCGDQAGWISGVTLPVHGGQQATSDAFRWVRAHNPVPPHRLI